MKLTHANAIIELRFNRENLVGCYVVRLRKGTVVGSNHGDIGVFAGTEFRITVARSRVDYWRGRGGGIGHTSGHGNGGSGGIGTI